MFNIYTKKNSNSTIPTDQDKAKNGGIKPDFRKYVDPSEEFGTKELVRSLWFTKHKVLLYKLLIGFLVAVSVLTWGYSLWSWGYFVIIEMPRDTKMRTELAARNFDFAAQREQMAAEQLSVMPATVLPAGENNFDAVSEVTNPNKDFIAKFSYYFEVGGARSKTETAIFLPGEMKLVAALGMKDGGSGEVRFVLENVEWARVSPHDVTDPIAWQAEHLDFTISNLSFLPAQSESGPQAHAIRFDFKNESPFGYSEANFLVGLYDRDVLVGVLPLQINSFESLETTTIDLRSFAPNLSIESIRVFPLINPYEKEAYLPANG